MAGDDFFKTRMGHRFYEATMPKSRMNSRGSTRTPEVLVAERRMLREARQQEVQLGPAAETDTQLNG